MNNSISPFMYQFNGKLADREKIFKLAEAILKDNKIEIVLLVRSSDYDTMLDEVLKNKVKAIIREIIPESIEIKITYKKTVSENTYIARCVMDYFIKEEPLVYPKISGREVKTEVEYDTIKVQMKVPTYVFAFTSINKVGEKLEAYLETKIMETPIVEFISESGEEEEVISKRRKPTRQEIARKTRKIDIELIPEGGIIGSVTAVRQPRYISDVIRAESQQETVCGKVSGLATRVSKKSGKKFFVFKLNDTNATIDVRYFPRKEDQVTKFELKMQNGIEVMAEGQIVMDNYSNKYGMFVSRMALCNILRNDDEEIDESEKNIVYDDYLAVTPESYDDLAQAGVYDKNVEIEALKGTFVVVDFETTGLTCATDVIVEIGACKIKDGTITELFGSLVNPERHIPQASTRIHGITDEDVADAPDLGDVIADFYKFSQGATLIAHNADFDMGFLRIAGKKFGYDFLHPFIDTLALSKSKVQAPHHKLIDMCKYFGIELTNAHRASHDALATAKVFRKLCEMT